MPLPRYQPVRKKPKVVGPSLNDLDDYCLSKIIGHALSMSSSRDEDSIVRDNGKTEKNLSLVSKRWYFLTQTQVGICGVHKIYLDKISRVEQIATGTKKTHHVPMSCRKPTNLVPRSNFGASTMLMNQTIQQRPLASTLKSAPTNESSPPTSIGLFRALQPKLHKYKNIQIDGTLSCNEFKSLLVALNAARIEQLTLKVRIEKDKTPAKDFAIMPKQMCHIEKLTFFWSNDIKSDFSNGLTWTIFERAINLKAVHIHLLEDASNIEQNKCSQFDRDSIESISTRFLDRPCAHKILREILFIRTFSDSQPICHYTSLIRSLLIKEANINQVETNDWMLIEHLIRSSDRLCTSHELKCLKFSTPIKSIDLLAQLMRSSNLGRNQLSVVIDNINQIEEVRLAVEDFNLTRQNDATCQLYLSLKDQKYADCEEKIKNLVYLSRLADVVINMNAQQRVSIDCCHLMWSVGRALQSSDLPGKCLFRIKLQILPLKHNANNYTEITIPFGRCARYKINSNREDINRHREIMKALKKDCYHQFVKSVRDNVTP